MSNLNQKNMKRIFVLFASVSLLFFYQGCNKENADYLSSQPELPYLEHSSNVKEYKSFVSSSLNIIFQEAFDGENINEVQALIFLDNLKPQILNKTDLKTVSYLPFYPIARSNTTEFQIDEKTLMENLTNNQYSLVLKMLNSETINSSFLDAIRMEALLITDKAERQLVLDIVDAISITIEEILSYTTSDGESYFTRSRQKSKGEVFACNVVSGVVGGIFGFVFGTISGPAAPVVAPVVTTLVAATVSTYAC